MTIHLPADLERYVQNEVLLGRFASEDEAIAEAVRLLRKRRQAASSPKPLSEDELDRQLTATGFLTAPTLAEAPSQHEFQPIPLRGEPLSETVIRERR